MGLSHRSQPRIRTVRSRPVSQSLCAPTRSETKEASDQGQGELHQLGKKTAKGAIPGKVGVEQLGRARSAVRRSGITSSMSSAVAYHPRTARLAPDELANLAAT